MHIAPIVVVCTLLTAEAVFSQPEAEKSLANALVIEEKGATQQALAEYLRIHGDDTNGKSVRARAGMGGARCLLMLGRTDEARATLGALDALVKGEAALEADLAKLKARLPGAASADPQQEEITKRVFELVNEGRMNSLVALGDTVVPVLKRIAEESLSVPRNPRVVSGRRNEPSTVAMQTLVQMGRPKARDAILALVTERKWSSRTRILNEIERRRPQEEIGDLWANVILAATQDPDREARQKAGAMMRWLAEVPAAVWQRVLNDSEGGVRGAAFQSLVQAPDIADRMLIDAFGRALADSFLSVRRTAFSNIESVRPRNYDAYVALRERALKDADPELRRDAYRGLSELPKPRSREHWVRGLDDPDSRVRKVCLEHLNRVVVAEDVPKIRTLLRDRGPGVRYAALGVLCRLPAEVACDSKDAEADLVACAEDRDSRTRMYALSLLARAGSKERLPLMEPFLHSNNSSERACAVYFILRHDLIQSLPKMLPILANLRNHGLPNINRGFNNDPNANDLGQAGIVSWMHRGHPSGAIALVKHMDNLNPAYVRNLAGVVSSVVPADRSREVFDALQAVKDTNRISGAITHLAPYFKDADYALDWYLRQLESPDDRVREAAAGALKWHGDATRVPALIAVLVKERQGRVVSVLSSAIAKHATADHVASLKAALGADDPTIQSHIIQTLGQIGSDASVDILIDRLSQDGPRRQVISFLGKQGVARAAPVLARLISQDELSRHDRIEAIRALGRIGDDSVVDVILAAMKEHGDTSTDSRFYCGTVEGKELRRSVHAGIAACYDLGEKTFLAVAEKIKKDDDEKIVASLMNVLAFVPSTQADRILEEGLRHESAIVRARAAYAVGHALLVNQSPWIRDLVRDPDASVRNAATTALRRFVELGVTIK